MKCDKAQVRIDAYVDGELSQLDREQMEAHLKDCPQCRSTLAQAKQVDTHTRLFEYSLPEGLKERIAGALQETVSDQIPMSRMKENLMMKKKLGMRLGFASAIVAAAIIAVITLTPHPAEAASAKVLWKKMAKAAATLRAAHITSSGPMPDGSRGKAEIWTDGKNLRWQMPDGTLSVVVDGVLYDNSNMVNPSQAEGQATMAMPLSIDPAMFTLEYQLMEIGGEGNNAEDRGVETLGGLALRKVGITSREGTERFIFWVNPQTTLPVRMTAESLSNGNWIDAGTTEYEFVDTLDPKLFDTKGLKKVSAPSQEGAAKAQSGGK